MKTIRNSFSPKLPTISWLLIAICPSLIAAQMVPANGLRHGVKGFTEPYRSIELAAPEMGTLATVNVREGDVVEANQILGRLNEDVLHASRAMIQETLASHGKLNAARAEMNTQQEVLRKVQGLFDREHASATELDRARGQFEIVKARYEAVQDELRVKQRELERVEAQIEQRRLRTPIDGIVTEVLKDEGEFVSSADPVVFKVVQLDPLLVILSIPQSHATSLQAGSEIELQIGVQRTPVAAIVEFVSPVADAQSGTCRVRFRIPNSDQRWQSGLPCFLNFQSFQSAQTSVPPASLRNPPSTPPTIARQQHPLFLRSVPHPNQQ